MYIYVYVCVLIICTLSVVISVSYLDCIVAGALFKILFVLNYLYSVPNISHTYIEALQDLIKKRHESTKCYYSVQNELRAETSLAVFELIKE